MSSKLQICCEAFMEAGWLAAVITLPLFFDISSVRMFEPDKVFVLKFLAVLSGAACLLKWIDRWRIKPDRNRIVAHWRPLLGSPLGILLLCLAAIYTLSSIFSVVPAESWWGSYGRAQGTGTFYCYLVLFVIVVSELRTSDQLQRLQYAFILTSLPVAAYTILQFLGSDPIPWRDVRYGRSSASMGNPIFLGAYLIMVIPLAFSRFVDAFGMLHTDGNKRPGFVLASCCGIALILQIFALLCTQSRGPVIGLVVAGYLCLFLFLVAKRNRTRDRVVFPLAAIGFGLFTPALLVLVAQGLSKFRAGFVIAGLGGTVVLIAGAFLILWHTRWGRSWLWLSWVSQTIALSLVIAGGSASLIARSTQSFPVIGRLVQLSNSSFNVRKSIWKTGIDAMRSRSPIILPNGKRDIFHALRPAIGYGPDCIWFPVNLHASAGLVEAHSGNADRMHNDVFDNFFATGFAGALLYLLIFAAAIFHSLRYLNLISGRRQTFLFTVMLAGGSTAGIFFPLFFGSPQMGCVGAQAGLLAGLFFYTAWCGFRTAGTNGMENSRQIFMLSILGALIAHFAETAVGIAIVSTRGYFFLLLAVLFVLASGNIKHDNPEKQRPSKPRPWAQTSLPAFTAIASLIVMVEAWCFIVNNSAERSTLTLFLETWFVPSDRQGLACPLPGNLILLLLTVGGGVALLYAERSNVRLYKRDVGKSTRLFLGFTVLAWLIMGFFAAFFWAADDPSLSSPMGNTLHAEARIMLFFFALILLLAATATALLAADFQRYTEGSPVRARSAWIGLLIAFGAFLIVSYATVRPARADIACHIARTYERSGNSAAAIQLYERASELAPRVVSYRISLGLAQSRIAEGNAYPLREAEQSLQRAVDLNPLDPYSLRTLGVFYMQTGEREPDTVIQKARLGSAVSCFQQAIRLAPNNPQAYNEMGRCYFLLGEHARAERVYEKSLQMYPKYAQTYMYMGELYYRQKKLDRALQNYSEAARLDRNNLEADKNVALLLTFLERQDEAIRIYLKVLQKAPEDTLLLSRLSSLYFGKGDYSAGLEFARRAYNATLPTSRPDFDAFLHSLQNQTH
jgi:tetratricopeptide (TPR) repeat protein